MTGGDAALYLYGIVRAGSRWGRRRTRAEAGEEPLRVRVGDLEALVRPAPFALPALDEGGVAAHQRMVEGAMRRGTILPAPYGVVFRGRRPLIRFLQDQQLVLDEALAFIEDHWELRLHIGPAGGEAAAASGEADPTLGELATRYYTELRRFARAAVPFRREGRLLLSAAFLVERTTWIEFIERTHDLASTRPELSFDVTGPWPPYDFVRMAV